MLGSSSRQQGSLNSKACLAPWPKAVLSLKLVTTGLLRPNEQERASHGRASMCSELMDSTCFWHKSLHKVAVC